jgi:AmmeMemoRadiSam system protein B
MGEARTPAVAGIFYPDDPDELCSTVRELMSDARASAPSAKAIVAPHAGYAYSGSVAARAFAAIARPRAITRVVLVGPAHRVAFDGVALPEARAFATPLGLVRVEAPEALLAMPAVMASDHAHAGEHSLEVELPFLQVVLGDVAVVPIAVGDVGDVELAEVIERAWGGDETCVVVSSDLSHYLAYERAKRVDEATARAIERLAHEDVADTDACGAIGVRALLRVARAKRLHATRLDLRSSGDTAGTRDRVVGYGAFAFA